MLNIIHLITKGKESLTVSLTERQVFSNIHMVLAQSVSSCTAEYFEPFLTNEQSASVKYCIQAPEFLCVGY